MFFKDGRNTSSRNRLIILALAYEKKKTFQKSSSPFPFQRKGTVDVRAKLFTVVVLDDGPIAPAMKCGMATLNGSRTSNETVPNAITSIPAGPTEEGAKSSDDFDNDFPVVVVVVVVGVPARDDEGPPLLLPPTRSPPLLPPLPPTRPVFATSSEGGLALDKKDYINESYIIYPLTNTNASSISVFVSFDSLSLSLSLLSSLVNAAARRYQRSSRAALSSSTQAAALRFFSSSSSS